MPVYEYREIPSAGPEVGGDDIYLGESFEVPGPLLPQASPFPKDGETDASDSITAAETYVHPTTGESYAFVAWNVTSDEPGYDRYVIDDLALRFTNPSTKKRVTATAWYAKVGPGPTPPAVACYGLDAAVNRFFRRSPIDHVTSKATTAWAGGDSRTVLTGDAAVDVSAAGLMQGLKLLDELTIRVEYVCSLTSWRMRRHAPEDPLALRQGDGGVAIAIYKRHLEGKITDIMDHSLFQLLHGRGKVSDLIAIITKGPVPTSPFASLHDVTRVLERLDHRALVAVRDRLRDLHAHTGRALEAAEALARKR